MILRTVTLLLALSIPTSVAVWGALSSDDPTVAASAPQDSAPREKTMAVTPQQSAAGQLTYALLSNPEYAYTPKAATPETVDEVFGLYLRALDGQGLFLTQADIESLAPQKAGLAAAIEGKDFAPVLAIYEAWNAHAQRQVQNAKALLQTPPDFTTDERWVDPDRENPWAPNAEALENVWRTYVKNDWLRLRLAGQDDAAIRQTLEKRYDRLASNLRQVSSDEAIGMFLNAYGASLDPHTNYLAPVEASTFAMNMSLSMEGVGAVLQAQDDHVVIRSLVAGGPAARSGKIKVGDKVMSVGQGTDGPMVDVVGWRIDEVVHLVRGKGGSSVRLGIIGSEAEAKPAQITLVRERISIDDQAATKKVLNLEGQKVGVIQLPTFYLDFEARGAGNANARSATADVAKLIEELKQEGVDSMLVDLRGNGGGSLTEAIELTGLFIDMGPVVQVRSSGGQVEVQGDANEGVAWSGPLAVVVDHASASASEIFAAAIQDHGRGLVVGESTFGKGTVQTLVDLDAFARSPGAQIGQVKLTIAQFFRINGHTTQRDGVQPDIAFPMTLNGDEAGESSLTNALPPSTIDPARYERINDLSPLLPRLQAAHQRRLASDAQLGWWMEDVQQFRAERDRKWVSLNETQRREETERRKRVVEARDAERRRLGLFVPTRQDDDGLYASERSIAEQVKAEEEGKASLEKAADPLLQEAAHVLVDAVTWDRDRISLR